MLKQFDCLPEFNKLGPPASILKYLKSKSATDKNVCSGRGNCVDVDKCKCNSKYIGKDCSKDRLIIVYAKGTANVYNLGWLYLLILILLIL